MTDTQTKERLPASSAANDKPAPPKPLLKAGGAVTAIVPQDIEQAYRLANVIASADMAPKSYKGNANKVMVGIMHGMEVGMTPMAALQSIAVINGMPSIYGDGAIGLVRSSGLLEDIAEVQQGDGENMVAICTLKRRDQSTPIVGQFSVADAKKADLWGKAGPWQQYPKRMLKMRARSWALRDGFADVLKGLHVAEEVVDMGDLVEGESGTYSPEPVAPVNEPWEFTGPFGDVSYCVGGAEFCATFVDGCKTLTDKDQAKEYQEANAESLGRLTGDLKSDAWQAINHTRDDLELAASETAQAEPKAEPEPDPEPEQQPVAYVAQFTDGVTTDYATAEEWADAVINAMDFPPDRVEVWDANLRELARVRDESPEIAQRVDAVMAAGLSE